MHVGTHQLSLRDGGGGPGLAAGTVDVCGHALLVGVEIGVAEEGLARGGQAEAPTGSQRGIGGQGVGRGHHVCQRLSGAPGHHTRLPLRYQSTLVRILHSIGIHHSGDILFSLPGLYAGRTRADVSMDANHEEFKYHHNSGNIRIVVVVWNASVKNSESHID